MTVTKKRIFNPNQRPHHFQDGFSLVEILVVVTLISLVFLAVPFGPQEGLREELQDTIEDIDRVVRYATDEAILRGVLTRIVFYRLKDPNEYVVQYANSEDTVAGRLKEDDDFLSLEEIEKKEKEKKKY